MQEIGAGGEYDRLKNVIGQYGIGFLSCFIIAERVEVTTQSRASPGEPGVRAVFTGATEWLHETVSDARPGTTVTLFLQKDRIPDPANNASLTVGELLNFDRLSSEIRRFGDLLPYPIFVHRSLSDETGTMENTRMRPWDDEAVGSSELIEYLRKRRPDSNEPLFATPFRLDGEGDKVEASGVIYIPSPEKKFQGVSTTVAEVDLFVRRMFITDDLVDILPEWAVFVSVVVDCPDLTPTLNRCDVIRHHRSFVDLKRGIGEKVIGFLEDMATRRPSDFKEFLAEHRERLYKALISDYAEAPDGQEEFFRRMIHHVPFKVVDHTRAGGQMMTLSKYRETSGLKESREDGGENRDRILYLNDLAAENQFRAVIANRSIPVVFASGDHDRRDAEKFLLKQYGEAFAGKVEVVDVQEMFQDVYLEKRINQSHYEQLRNFLMSLSGDGPDEVIVSEYEPKYVPAILATNNAPDDEDFMKLVKKHSAKLPARVRRALEDDRHGESYYVVILNAGNEVIRKIREHCDSGRSIDGEVADALHEIYHAARSVSDSGVATSEHYFDHRNKMLLNSIGLGRRCETLQEDLDRMRATTPLRTEASGTVEMKTGSLLLTDISGSTRMMGFMDKHDGASVMKDYAEQVIATVKKYGGIIEKFTGDGLFAYFPDEPGSAAETNEAVKKAARCALEVQAEATDFFENERVRRVMQDSNIVIDGSRTVLHHCTAAYVNLGGQG
ncbi:MAG: hypothetical protein AAF492_11230, partial [Verrucomicrobiota bacterium]